ncbi:MAG: hypothetical protein N3B10_07385 [Armatimonadetes bacterium]|nr:hypothetical protein [Armatimonadota bacterium]MCX7968297.1 hypothetical protein [Armatimonadota bacterium]MDW8144368.1 hypothetical protein [Armatimonadota bacterium]
MKTGTKVYVIAAIIGLLPKRWRYRFFNHFHSELREHFAKPTRKHSCVGQLSEVSVPCTSLLSFERDGIALTVKVRFNKSASSLWLHWKRVNERGRFALENPEEIVRKLVEVVRGLNKSEQRLLWTILDNALIDYEDYLIANDPRWLKRLNRARKEKGRPFEEVRSELMVRG